MIPQHSLVPLAPPTAELARAPLLAPAAVRPVPWAPHWAVIRRQVPLVVAAGAIAGLAALLVERQMDPVYEGTATVRVDVKQGTLHEVYTHVVTGGEVGSEIDLLKSRVLMEHVVDSLGLRVRVIRPAAARAAGLVSVRAARVADSGRFSFRREGDGFAVFTGKPAQRTGVARVGVPVQVAGATVVLAPAALREPRIDLRVDGFDVAVAALREDLPVERDGRESQVVTIGYRSADPALARDVPNAAVAEFLAMRRRNQRIEARSTAEALRGQVRTLSGELAASDSTLRGFRERGGVVDPQQEGTTQIARVAELRTNRARLGAERDALASLMRSLADESASGRSGELPYRRLGGFPTLINNEVVARYVTALTTVEEQRAALLVRRTPEDPDVQALTDRARAIEQQLRSTAAAYLDGLSRQTASIDAELARTEGQLARLPGQEAEYARLERGPKVLGEMLTLLQTRLKEAEVAGAVEDPSVQLLDPAIMPTRPVRPRPARDVSLAAVAGLLLGLAAVIAREQLNRTVRSQNDVQTWTGLPVVGTIPEAAADALSAPGVASGSRRLLPRGRRLVLVLSRRADANRLMLAEAYARLETRVVTSLPANGTPHTIVVTSPLAGEGKSTTVEHLARTTARTGARTLVIDADLRRGSQHTRLDVARGPGLAEVLAGEARFHDVVRRVDVGDGFTLSVIPAGGPVDPTRRLITAATVRALFAQSAAGYDSIFIDAPPLNLTADAAVLAGAADGVLVVARAGQTSLDALARAAQQLADVQAIPIGVVVNGIDSARDVEYGAEYRYYADPAFGAAG